MNEDMMFYDLSYIFARNRLVIRQSQDKSTFSFLAINYLYYVLHLSIDCLQNWKYLIYSNNIERTQTEKLEPKSINCAVH